MSDPYVGSGPAGADGTDGAAVAGPAKYVGLESVTWLTAGAGAAGAVGGGVSKTGVCPAVGAVGAEKSEMAGCDGTCGWTGPVIDGMLFSADVGAPWLKAFMPGDAAFDGCMPASPAWPMLGAANDVGALVGSELLMPGGAPTAAVPRKAEFAAAAGGA